MAKRHKKPKDPEKESKNSKSSKGSKGSKSSSRASKNSSKSNASKKSAKPKSLKGFVKSKSNISVTSSTSQAQPLLARLSSLSSKSAIFIWNSSDPLEVSPALKVDARYCVLDITGQRIFDALSIESNCLSTFILEGGRPFHIQVRNSTGKNVLHVKRACTYCLCWWGAKACRNDVVIHDGHNRFLGRCRSKCSFSSPNFTIEDEWKKVFCKIIGPSCGNCCPSCMCRKSVFDIIDCEGKKIGEIRKRWTGVFKDIFTSNDLFGATFPLDWSLQQKILLMGALFLIDFQYFEASLKNSKGRKKRLKPDCTGSEIFFWFIALMLIVVIILYVKGVIKK